MTSDRHERSSTRIARRIGPYELVGELGRGGMGAVFKAVHQPTGAVHAFKVLAPAGAQVTETAVARFRREAEALARISPHPALAAVHSSGVTPRGDPWMAMDLVEGESLAVRLRRTGALPTREAAALVVTLARAVEHVHGHGVLHRDIKPGNVVVDAEGRPHLVDFGLAYDPAEVALTATGQLVGTPAFMAPEQVAREQGGARLGPPTDVYGLGALLYTLIAGRPPFEGESDLNIVAAVMKEEPTAPSRAASADGLAPAFDEVCLRALRKDPSARPRSAAAFADELEAILASGASAPTARDGAPRRSSIGLVLVAVLIVAVATIAWAVGVGRPAPDPVIEGDPWGDAMARLAAGDLTALDRAEAAAAGDREREQLIETLRDLVAGDAVAVRTVRFDEEPWRGLRSAVGCLLVEAGRLDDLVRVAEHAPTITRDPLVIAALERFGAAFDGDEDDLAAALTLASGDEVDDGGLVGRLADLRFRMLSVWLDRRIADGANLDDLDEVPRGALTRALRRDDRRELELSAATRRRLFDRFRAAETPVPEQLSHAELLLACSTLSVDRHAETLDQLLGMLVSSAITGQQGLIAVEGSYLLLRARAFPMVLSNVRSHVIDRDRVASEVRAELELPAGARSATRIAALTFIGSERGVIGPGGGVDPDPIPIWPSIEAVLRLDATEPDGCLPGWVLATVTVLLWTPSGRKNDELEARADALLDELWGSEPGRSVWTRLLEEAYRRELREPVARRMPQTAFLLAAHGQGSYAQLDVLREGLVWAIERRELFLQGPVAVISGASSVVGRHRILFVQATARSAERRDAHRSEPCDECARITNLVALMDATERLGEEARVVEVFREWAHDRPERALERLDVLLDSTGGDEHLPVVVGLIHGARIMLDRDREDVARALLERTGEATSALLVRAELWDRLGETDRARADRAAYERLMTGGGR